MTDTNPAIPTEREARRLRQKLRYGMRLLELLPDGPFRVEDGDKLTVHSKLPNRRRPDRSSKGEGWKEYTDLCTIAGGKSEQARALAEFIAVAPDLVTGMIEDICRLLSALTKCGTPPPSEPAPETVPEPIARPDVSRIVPAWRRFMSDVADALDHLFDEAGGESVGLHVSDRNAHPAARLIEGGHSTRRSRADVMRAFVAVVDPDFDVDKLSRLPASQRVAANGLPSAFDFWSQIPEYLHEQLRSPALRDETDLRLAELDRLSILKRGLSADELIAEHLLDAARDEVRRRVPNAEPEAIEVLAERVAIALADSAIKESSP